MKDQADEVTANSEIPLLLKLISRTRWISVIPVIASLAASLLMLLLGIKETVAAFAIAFERGTNTMPIGTTEEATLRLLEALDDFLIGLAFLYFAYGIYALFINFKGADLDIPQWLRVRDIAVLKKSLLEVLLVLLSVVFVKRTLEVIHPEEIQWKILVIPFSIVAIALSTRLMSQGEAEE
ncbi:MAG TPA: YqhA family protein [Xenococcaceae cyanobacterium]